MEKTFTLVLLGQKSFSVEFFGWLVGGVVSLFFFLIFALYFIEILPILN